MTQILFLRETSDPEKVYGTIEVRGDSLVQAKARCNSRLPEEACEFLRFYCKQKKLRINTCDIKNAG